MSDCAIILLAAGASRRMGGEGSKLLLQYQGQSFLQRAVATALQAKLGPVVVVVGAYAAELQSEIADSDVRCVVNTEWESGMASSIRTGLAEAVRHGDIDGVVILLADQPLITADRLAELATVCERATLLASATLYPDGPGVPAYFSAKLFHQLAELQGEKGAKVVLQRLAPEEIYTVSPGGCAADIDTPDDWRHFLTSTQVAKRTPT